MIEINLLGGMCPVQAEGYYHVDLKRYPFYLRGRGTRLVLSVFKNETDFNNLDNHIWEREIVYPYPEAGYVSTEKCQSFIEEAYKDFVTEKYV